MLVDAGLPGRQVEVRLRDAGLKPEAVAALVVTHEHRDHLSGVGVWARRYRVPVYMTAACLEAAPRVLGADGLKGVEVREFELGRAFPVADLEFLPVSTSHDTVDSVGFRISDGDRALGFATDLGFVSHLVRHSLRGAHLLYLESNHDEDLLMKGPYPWHLKQRIRSRHGHLSNEDAAQTLDELLHPGLRTVVLGHLSEINNEARFAYGTARRVLAEGGAEADVTLLVARQDRAGRLVRV